MKMESLTREQADKIIEIIRQDATMSGVLCNYDNTKQCVIGGLAKAAGVNLLEIEVKTISIRSMAHLAEILSREYGLSMDQMENLQVINDSWINVTGRRIELINKVNSWVIE